MAAVQSAPIRPISIPKLDHGMAKRSTGIQIHQSSVAMPAIPSAARIRNSHIALDSYSPVNQNGSFEFDRVLKCGLVEKRTRKTKAWKHIYLVLRPNLLSIYKDQEEDKLRHKIHLSDLTAVALVKDPKNKRQNVFGLFTPSRNYHLEAPSSKDAEEWVDLIRREARIEEEEEEMFLGSPGARLEQPGFRERRMRKESQQKIIHDERLGSSSPEPVEPTSRVPKQSPNFRIGQPRISQSIDYSGNEFSEMSDSGMGSTYHSRSKVSIPSDHSASGNRPQSSSRPITIVRNVSQLSINNQATEPFNDPDRIIFQDHLLYLKTTGGVRQWKSLWVVLRPRSLAVYKTNAEYAPVLIIPMSTVIDAVEIDALSRTKRNCLQVITEEKSYRFCARDEEGLDRCLGAFKSLLKRRRGDKEAHAQGRA